MSELSILELETEHVELLPEREALGIFANFGGNYVSQHATSVAIALGGNRSGGNLAASSASNVAIVG
jgi:hypothetical protein